MKAWQLATTVADPLALPKQPGQVAIVPEYVLLDSGHADDYAVVAPSDATALLRYTWYPTAAAASDPPKLSALARLKAALTGQDGLAAIAAHNLRAGSWPAAAPEAATPTQLPAPRAPAMDVIIEHVIWHVLTTWQPAQRVANMLIAVDVSGSMAAVPRGSDSSVIGPVRQGVDQVTRLLPQDSRLGLWRFGSQLAPPHDHQQLVPIAALDTAQRHKLDAATARLAAKQTGTGLYDTVLGGYRYLQRHFRAGVPNELIVFTDGVNQDDANSISLAHLRAALAATDPHNKVQLAIFAFGNRLPTTRLTDALAPVAGQVDPLTGADEVVGAFVHAVSGGLTH
jgi:hypothetical protein